MAKCSGSQAQARISRGRRWSSRFSVPSCLSENAAPGWRRLTDNLKVELQLSADSARRRYVTVLANGYTKEPYWVVQRFGEPMSGDSSSEAPPRSPRGLGTRRDAAGRTRWMAVLRAECHGTALIPLRAATEGAFSATGGRAGSTGSRTLDGCPASCRIVTVPTGGAEAYRKFGRRSVVMPIGSTEGGRLTRRTSFWPLRKT